MKVKMSMTQKTKNARGAAPINPRNEMCAPKKASAAACHAATGKLSPAVVLSKKGKKALRDENIAAFTLEFELAVASADVEAATAAFGALSQLTDLASMIASNLAYKLAKRKNDAALRALLLATNWDHYEGPACELARDFASGDEVEALGVMADLGFDLNDGRLPLIFSAIEAFADRTVDFLIPHTDFSLRAWEGALPMTFAAQEGNLKALLRLLMAPEAWEKGAPFGALEHCTGHHKALDAAMLDAILSRIDVNVPMGPYEHSALIELAEYCDCEQVARRVAQVSTAGFEDARQIAIAHGNHRFAAGIASAR